MVEFIIKSDKMGARQIAGPLFLYLTKGEDYEKFIVGNVNCGSFRGNWIFSGLWLGALSVWIWLYGSSVSCNSSSTSGSSASSGGSLSTGNGDAECGGTSLLL
jgi:hypothetical protein